MTRDHGLSVEIRDGAIVIAIGVYTLRHAISLASNIDDPEGEILITDSDAFARDLVSELNREDEQGTTPVHRLLDQAAKDAVAQGCGGVDFDEMERRRLSEAD